MNMTAQQAAFLEILQTVRCIRADQLLELMRRRFHTPGTQDFNEGHMASILRQLRYGNWDIRQADGVVGFSNAEPDPSLLEAVDVALELSSDPPTELRCGKAPVLLRFVLQGEKVRLFTVAWLQPGTLFEDLSRHRMERIIWLSESGAMPSDMALPHKHFFAVRQPDGTHRFYGSPEP